MSLKTNILKYMTFKGNLNFSSLTVSYWNKNVCILLVSMLLKHCPVIKNNSFTGTDNVLEKFNVRFLKLTADFSILAKTSDHLLLLIL